MAVQESLRPQPVKTTDQRRPVRQALAATAASLGLLAGVVAAGAALSGTWSVSAAWNRAVATVTALPEYRVALSLFEDGSSADFARDLLAAELDSAAVGESLFFLPVRDLLETAAAFEGVGVEGGHPGGRRIHGLDQRRGRGSPADSRTAPADGCLWGSAAGR